MTKRVYVRPVDRQRYCEICRCEINLHTKSGRLVSWTTYRKKRFCSLKCRDENRSYVVRKSSLEEHLASLLDTSAGEEGCWPIAEIYQSKSSKFRYGVFSYFGKKYRGHVVAWVLANNRQAPEGSEIRHRCDNPPCCNPKHLEVGTRQDNIDDKVLRGRSKNPKGVASKKSKLTANDVSWIRRAHREQLATFEQVRQKLNIKKSTHMRALFGYGAYGGDNFSEPAINSHDYRRVTRGRQSIKPKYSDTEVAGMRRDRVEGVTYSKLTLKYSVSEAGLVRCLFGDSPYDKCCDGQMPLKRQGERSQDVKTGRWLAYAWHDE